MGANTPTDYPGRGSTWGEQDLARKLKLSQQQAEEKAQGIAKTVAGKMVAHAHQLLVDAVEIYDYADMPSWAQGTEEAAKLTHRALSGEAIGRTAIVEATREKIATTIPDDVREEVAWMARHMEAQLRANDHKPGWKDMSLTDGIMRLMEESLELGEAIDRFLAAPRDATQVIREASDVCNFAMFLADIIQIRATQEEQRGAQRLNDVTPFDLRYGSHAIPPEPR